MKKRAQNTSARATTAWNGCMAGGLCGMSASSELSALAGERPWRRFLTVLRICSRTVKCWMPAVERVPSRSRSLEARRECAGYDHGITFHAFDLTPEMVKMFRHRIQEQRLTNVQVIRSDILSLTSLPEAWTGYDPAVCSAVLEYIPRELRHGCAQEPEAADKTGRPPVAHSHPPDGPDGDSGESLVENEPVYRRSHTGLAS